MNNERRPAPPPLAAAGLGLGCLGLLALVVFLPFFIWFYCRIEPGSDQIAILIRKTGQPLTPDQIVAEKPDQQGIQLNVLSAGRYFYNPYTWSWKYASVLEIPAGKLGVVTRLHGQDLPRGQILATADSKGILHDVLQPGRHFINPFAFSVELFDAISIKPGCVGVVTRLVGRDGLDEELAPAERNGFLVPGGTAEAGLKGVVAETLDPGTYYLNPYLLNVVEVNLQSQRFEMDQDEPLIFLTLDGFIIHVQGTIEFGLERQKVALLTHRVGDMDDVLKKIILPRARGFIRTEGSKHPAVDYIVGETRQSFQNRLAEHLRQNCADQGVDIKSVLIRNITPPDEIASVIRDRELAVQEAFKIDQQIEQAKSRAELAKQEMLAQQNKEKVEAETVKLRAVIKAKQEMAVKLTAAQQQLEVAQLENQAAAAQAAARLSGAQAERDVIRLGNEAQASVLRTQIEAFGGGENFARHALLQKLGPRLQSILTGDDPGGLGGVFRSYVPSPREEVKP